MTQTLRIDAHHHFWQIGKYSYPWIEPGGVLDQSFGPGELAPLLARRHFERSILVQTIPSLDETRWFLELAEAHPRIAGVVGWVDLTAATVESTLDELISRQGRRLIGIRHNLHDEADDRWILRDDVSRGLTALERRGLAYDLLIRPRHLPVVLELARQHPKLCLVVDHAAKPAIAAGGWDDWARSMSAVARCDQVFCKLSGLITEADHQRWRPADLAPYINHVVSAFGPERVMFGSDWPVCLLAGTYERVVDAIAGNIEGLSAGEQDQIFGATAAQFYQLMRVM